MPSQTETPICLFCAIDADDTPTTSAEVQRLWICPDCRPQAEAMFASGADGDEKVLTVLRFALARS